MNEHCWTWIKCRQKSGYGRRTIAVGKTENVHVLVWRELNGPVPSWGELHHLCHNKACYNPSHMMVVSRRAHLHIHGKYARTCKRGHPWATGDIIWTKRKTRLCRKCRLESKRLNWRKRYKELHPNARPYTERTGLESITA